METYFGPAVIGSSEPDPEALRLGVRSECFPARKRQPGESVKKKPCGLDERHTSGDTAKQRVSDLLIGNGQRGCLHK